VGGAPLLWASGVVINLHGASRPSDQERHSIAVQAVRAISPRLAAEAPREGARVKRPFAELWGTGIYSPPASLTNDGFLEFLTPPTLDSGRHRDQDRACRVGRDERCMGKARLCRSCRNRAHAALIDAIVYATASARPAPPHRRPAISIDPGAKTRAFDKTKMARRAPCSSFGAEHAEGNHRGRASRATCW